MQHPHTMKLYYNMHDVLPSQVPRRLVNEMFNNFALPTVCLTLIPSAHCAQYHM